MGTPSEHAPSFWRRFLSRLRLFSPARPGVPGHGELERLRAEIDLLTSHFTDSVYRLRYDTMEYDYISPSISNLLGYDPAEIRTNGFRSLILETRIISEGMRPVHSYKDYELKRERGEVLKWQADYLMRTKDGRQIWVSDISHPWSPDGRRVIGSIGILRDITDRVEAEQSVKEELTRLAATDPLTGLFNRRVFFERLDGELKRIGRSKGRVCLLILDVDRFKAVNDTRGHDIGDRVLLEMATIIKQCLRESDVAARLGGEEFGAILVDADSSSGAGVAERMRVEIESRPFGSDLAVPLHCTVSIGVAAAFHDLRVTSQLLYKQADTLLYRAKEAGRNRVVAGPAASAETAARADSGIS